MSVSPTTVSKIRALLNEEGLPVSYGATVDRFLVPLAAALAHRQRDKGRTLVVAVSGAQGTGKSTLTAFLSLLLEEGFGLPVASFSLDDIYLPRAERQILARDVHPMLAVRGVPGTHDISLGVSLVRQLLNAGGNDSTAIPAFDKSRDDRRPADQWPVFSGKPSVILVEGWCVGAKPVSERDLVEPINVLEREQDPHGVWRRYVNQQLNDVYPRLFSLFDTLVMLAAPGWEVVYRWRQLQEIKLRDKCRRMGLDGGAVMSADEVAEFIQYYERVTRHCLEEMPGRADYLLAMDEDHRIVRLSSHNPGEFTS